MGAAKWRMAWQARRAMLGRGESARAWSLAKAWGTSWRARAWEGVRLVPAGRSKAGRWVWRISRVWARAAAPGAEAAKGLAGTAATGKTPG